MTSKSVQENLAHAFAIESRASARSAAFARMADRETHPRLARLFRAISNAESVHARRFHLLMRGKIGSSAENLKAALKQKTEAADKEYPSMVREAEEKSKAVRKAFRQSMETNSEHAELYQGAMKNRLSKGEIQYYVCQICGHIQEDFVPENCPICGAVSGRFEKVN